MAERISKENAERIVRKMPNDFLKKNYLKFSKEIPQQTQRIKKVIGLKKVAGKIFLDKL